MELFVDCLTKYRNYIKWSPFDTIRVIYETDGYIIHEDIINKIRFSRKTMVIDFKNDEYRVHLTDDTFRLYKMDIKRYLRGWIVIRGNYQLITEKPMNQVKVELVKKSNYKETDISFDPIEIMPEDNQMGVVRVGYLTYT